MLALAPFGHQFLSAAWHPYHQTLLEPPVEQCHRLRRVSGLSSVFFLENRILIPAPMSDKLNFLPESLSRLESYSLLTLEGPDAVAFLQAQSMNDVKALSDGQWHWNGL